MLGGIPDDMVREALGVKTYGMHPHTVREELLTLHARHLVATPAPDLRHQGWGRAREALKELRKQLPPMMKIGLRDLLHKKSGRARARFMEGWHEYKREGIQWWHAKITCMQKLELHPKEKLEPKADRAIQFRSVAYNAALAQYLWPLEHRLFAQTLHNGFRWCAKGLDKHARALLLLDMAKDLVDPVFVLADHSTFDAHVNTDLLKLEHGLYNKVWKHPELRSLLKMQLRNVGRTKGGIRYRVKGTRMSGDVNTALGNSIINYGILASWCKGTKARICLDGDDSVIVMERSELSGLVPLDRWALAFGMVTKLDVVDSISEAEFCQSRVVLGRNGPYLCPNPAKVLDVIGKSPQIVRGGEANAILAGGVQCELIANPCMPLLRPLSEWLAANDGPRLIAPWYQYRWQEGYGGKQEDLDKILVWEEPTEDERMSFAKAWGISPQDQELFERTVKFKSFHAGPYKPPATREPSGVDYTLEMDAADWADQQPWMVEESPSVVPWGERSEEERQLYSNLLM